MDDYDEVEIVAPLPTRVDLALWLWLMLGLIMVAASVLLVA